MQSARKILIVDDDQAFRERLARAFHARRLDVMQAYDVNSALELIISFQPEWLLVDLKMPGTSGLELVTKVTSSHPQIRTVVLTGYGSITTALQAVKLGAYNYLTKPPDADRILAGFEDKAETQLVSNNTLNVPSLDAVEWEHIQRVLAECSGNISKAAKLLGLERRSLQRKLAKAPVST